MRELLLVTFLAKRRRVPAPLRLRSGPLWASSAQKNTSNKSPQNNCTALTFGSMFRKIRLHLTLFSLTFMAERPIRPVQKVDASEQATKRQLKNLPPQNIEAEEAVLGSLLIDKEAVTKVADTLAPEDFYRDKNGMVFEAMLDLYSHNDPLDLVSLSNRLAEKNQLKPVGGRAYLATLATVVPTSGNVKNYANIVSRKATLRRLISAASDIINLGYQEEQEVEDLLDTAEQALFQVSQKHLTNNFTAISHVLTEAFERIDEIHKNAGKLRGIASGFGDLDSLLGGLQKSDLVIIAARPSMGKTSLALDIARQVAVKGKVPVGIFSLEMSKEQLVDRLLCAEANIDMWKMRTGRLSDKPGSDDFPRIGHAMGVLSEAPIFIDDSGMANIMEVRTKARRLKAEHNLGLLVVDYLQLMEGRSSDNRTQEVAEISRGLKSIAKELNIPVLALSQLSRAVEQSSPPVPKLSHLRESGSIEQDADVVAFIYREEYYNKDSDRQNRADVFIAKHRNGPTGQIELYFDKEKVSFRNLAKSNDGAPPPSFE